MKRMMVMMIFVLAFGVSSAFAQKQTTAGSAESRTGEQKSTPSQAISDRSSKPATASPATLDRGNQTTGQRTSTTGSPSVNLPSTQNSTRTGQQSSAPPQSVNGNPRKP